MTREFIMMQEFDEKWSEAKLTDDDLRELQEFLCQHPDYGDLIQGTGGVRKIRWAAKNKGKSGGVRAIYLDVVFAEKIYLLTAYQKNEKTNLTNAEKAQTKKLVSILKHINER